MFATANTSKLARRTLGALRLTRSFLLLEDDYDVDWEVDSNEPLTQPHPHRVMLRGPGRRSRQLSRRGGEVPGRQLACLTPVENAKPYTAVREARPARMRGRTHRAPAASTPHSRSER
jgi:hypothetical protein